VAARRTLLRGALDSAYEPSRTFTHIVIGFSWLRTTVGEIYSGSLQTYRST
jgi:hypothetical protein